MSATEPATVEPSVCVIIAAYNAAATVGRSIASALAQREVAEVIVIDDASTDATAAVARACDDATGRLSVVRLDQNAGPSKARNIAIAQSRAPFIAILDSDDFFLPGRFTALLTAPDWDLVADNLVFVAEDAVDAIDSEAIAAHRIVPRTLDAAAFVEGSISRADRYKGELGFLKPVLARVFLDRHALRYAEDMRLSEDYDLYVRALIAGARFRLAATCHYVAVERAGSLSVAHGLGELAAVDAAMGRLRAAAAPGDGALQSVLRRHHAQIARKRRHRAVLARKRDVGTLRALREQADSPTALFGILADVVRDKLRLGRPKTTQPAPGGLRFLL